MNMNSEYDDFHGSYPWGALVRGQEPSLSEIRPGRIKFPLKAISLFNFPKPLRVDCSSSACVMVQPSY